MPRFRMFPGIIFVLLGMNVVVVAITVYAAHKDGGAAIEPDYYRKALAYDTLQERQLASASLGWTVTAEFEADPQSGENLLRIIATDGGGGPLTGAVVHADAFPSVRANERSRLLCREIRPGIYAAPLTLTRAGSWRIEATVESRDHVFVQRTDIATPGTP